MPAGAAVAAAGSLLGIAGFDPSRVLELRLLADGESETGAGANRDSRDCRVTHPAVPLCRGLRRPRGARWATASGLRPRLARGAAAAIGLTGEDLTVDDVWAVAVEGGAPS